MLMSQQVMIPDLAPITDRTRDRTKAHRIAGLRLSL